MRRWGSLAAAAALTATSACGGRKPPAYGPVPVYAPPSPAPAPAPPPAPAATDDRAPIASAAPAVKVGLVVDAPNGMISSPSGLTVETEAGENIDELQQGRSVAFASEPDGSITMTVVDAAGSMAGRTRYGLQPPVVVRAADGGVVDVRGTAYRGAILVQRAGRSGLTFVNRLDVESYLLGVVPRETGDVDAAAYEMVKAQAVAARTYAVSHLGGRASLGFDVYPGTQDQVYGGVAAERESISRAVRETAGQVAMYGGQPIDAYYHSTCAGRTAAIEEVWNVRPVPYLVSVVDEDASGRAWDRASSRFTWTERWTHAQLVSILNRTLADSLRGRRIREVEDVDVLSRTPSGRVRAMRIETDAGTFTVGRDRVRWILAPVRGGILNSSKFEVRTERSDGRIESLVAEGGGWGHGVGMCQVGAMGRARAGQSYREILEAYYPGIRVERMY